MTQPTHPRDASARWTEFGTTAVAELERRKPVAAECVVHPPFRVRRWILDLLSANGSHQEIADALLGRLISGRSDLHEAQRVLNDLGRRSGGAAVLKRVVTPINIARLQRKG